MDARRLFLLITVLTAPCLAHAQCTLPERQATANETQAKGHWTDPCTGLTWAAKDNGKDLIWQDAVKYCKHLSLAGHTDWRLPALSELQGIYDKKVDAPGINLASHWHGEEPIRYHVLGGLFLHGDEWSNGAGRGQKDYWDFLNGSGMGVDSTMIFGLFSVASPAANALCVRGVGSPPLSEQNGSLKLTDRQGTQESNRIPVELNE